MSGDKLPIVTQADELAAEKVLDALLVATEPEVLSPEECEAEIVQAFARHRIAAETKAATTITELVSALEECQQALEWIRAQAENAMSTSAGCATTHGDPGGGLEMVNSYASDIAANAEMAGEKLVTALSNTRGDTK